MIHGGNATIFVADMDRAVEFYTQVLGLKLTNRFGNSWATVEAGPGLTIGLHPASNKHPAPGTRGAMVLGLEIDGTMEAAVARLARRGVEIEGSILRDEGGVFAHLADPDGNRLYLWETAPVPEAVAG